MMQEPTPTPTPPEAPTATPPPPPTDAPTAIPTETPPLPTATPLPPPANIGPTDYPATINPLTGLEPADPSVLQNRRPILIKISNAPEIVRPQSGHSQADIMFEHYAEGGWTRFSAIFWSSGTDHVGAIRSVRLVDLMLGPAFDAIIAFSGGSLGVVDTIKENDDIYPYNTVSPHFGVGEPYFARFRRDDLPLEHTMFANLNLVWDYLEERGSRTETTLFTKPGMVFNPVPAGGGQAASVISIDYWKTSVEWRYDPVSGQYLRWTDGIPHSDALTGEQMAFENVIVVRAFHELQELFPEKYFGAEVSWFIGMTGSDTATVFRDGLAYEGSWVRLGEEDMLTYYDADGNPIPLKPGRTFIQIISSEQGAYTGTPERVIIEQ